MKTFFLLLILAIVGSIFLFWVAPSPAHVVKRERALCLYFKEPMRFDYDYICWDFKLKN